MFRRHLLRRLKDPESRLRCIVSWSKVCQPHSLCTEAPLTPLEAGLVEISTKRGEGAVLTRTIGDPSTGTEPVRADSSSPSDHSSATQVSTPPERPDTLNEESSDATIKPPRLELPKPRDFALEDSAADGASPTSPVAQVVTPGSTSSTAALSTTTNSSTITYESGMRVLVVDDDTLTRKLMSRMLTRLGCLVTTAENGEIALDLILSGTRPTPSSEETGSSGLLDGPSPMPAEEYRYAVVFLDNQMPVMSGLEAVTKLRHMGRRDFIVGVTGR